MTAPYKCYASVPLTSTIQVMEMLEMASYRTIIMCEWIIVAGIYLAQELPHPATKTLLVIADFPALCIREYYLYSFRCDASLCRIR